MSSVALDVARFRPGAGAELLYDWIGKGTRTERRWRRLLDGFLLMAGSAGDVYEKKILDLLFGATALTAPGTVYIGLWGSAGAINDASDGGTAGEVSGGSYARIAVTNNNTNWPNASGTTATKHNGTLMQFPAASANWNSGNPINQAAILDANAGTSADKIIVWGDLLTPKIIQTGDQGQFAVNDITITQD